MENLQFLRKHSDESLVSLLKHAFQRLLCQTKNRIKLLLHVLRLFCVSDIPATDSLLRVRWRSLKRLPCYACLLHKRMIHLSTPFLKKIMFKTDAALEMCIRRGQQKKKEWQGLRQNHSTQLFYSYQNFLIWSYIRAYSCRRNSTLVRCASFSWELRAFGESATYSDFRSITKGFGQQNVQTRPEDRSVLLWEWCSKH